MRRRLKLVAALAGLGLFLQVPPAGRVLAQEIPGGIGADLTVKNSAGLDDLTRPLPLTLEQGKRAALDNNLDLQNARRDLRMAELDITRAKAGYDPYFKTDSSYSESTKPSSQAVFGNTSKTSSVNLSTGVTTVTGGNVSVDFRNSRSESDSVFSTLNPSYNTDLTLNVSQPLLKNRYNDTRAMDLEQKRNDYERTRLALESKTLDIESQVEDAYWSLVRSRLDLDLKRKSVELAQRMNEITKTQVRAGASAAVSTTQTEANLASAKAGLIRSENDYRKSQTTLKMVLNLEDQDFWSLEIIPTDLPRYQPVEFDKNAVISEALANNFSLMQSKLSIRNAEITNLQARNRTEPQLDLRGSVGVSGLAGTDNPQDSLVETGFVVPNPLPPAQFPQPYMVERIMVPGQPSDFKGDYMDALNNMLEGDNLSWSAGLTLNVPLGNRAAKSDLERTLLSYEKMLSDLKNSERQVFINMINIIYDLDAAHRSLKAAREAGRLQGQNLAVEEKKFQLGLNTSYEVLQAEENYEEARSSEIGALIEYNKAVGRLDRARQGFISGAGVSAASLPSGLSSGLSSGGLTGGIDSSAIQQLSGSLPAGLDINSLQGMMP
ncbi:MAG TPA: TolC family protein [bacterium]|nr:TolC family protein [bacterium]